MVKRILLIGLALHFALLLKAQTTDETDKNPVYKAQHTLPNDTTSLLSAFKNGQINGHVRYMFMSTQNEKGLTDYYANAIGLGLRFETAGFHHIQFALSGFSTVNIGSSDLTKPDALTGQYNRYEIGNFDITNPAKKTGLNRIEEFYLKYSFKNTYLKVGRQFINSTFINLQDGRMAPTAVEGVWTEINDIKKLKLHLGWLWKLSPRSTTHWYKPGSTLGFYPTGVNLNGVKSGYANSIESSGVGIVQAIFTVTKQFKIQASNLFAENIFNSSLLQIDYSHPLKSKSSLFTSLQVVKQFSINDGGNANQAKTYFSKGGSSLAYGARMGWRNKLWETSLNCTRITSEGRYLIPREWGIEPFFTFLPRERNEGFGDVNAITGKVNYSVPKTMVKASLAVGYYHLPDVKNFVLNKYGMPSYTQLNADIRYAFSNTLKGLEAQVLIVGKFNNGETYSKYKYIFNKVNLAQYNVMLNYNF